MGLCILWTCIPSSCWGKPSPRVCSAPGGRRKSWCLSSRNNSLGPIHWWGRGGEYILSLHIFTFLRSQSPRAPKPSFHLVLKLFKRLVPQLPGHKVGILHSLCFALDSLPVLIKSPELTEFTRSNFYLSLWKGRIIWPAPKWIHFETPVEFLSAILKQV